MKISRKQLMKIIKEELEELSEGGMPGMSNFDGGPPANVPCYLVYSGYKTSDPYIRYASGSLDEVKNFLQWARENGEKMHEFSVVEAAGDQLIGGNEKEIPQDLLRNL